MSIRDKLKIYDSGSGDSKKPGPGDLPGGEKILTPGGAVWKFTSTTPLRDLLRDIDSEPPENFSALARHHRVSIETPPESLAFIDLETTSLSTGTGNYPFLTGVGYVSGESFIVEQFFMGEYAAEGPMLEMVLPLIQDRTLVTFNGKSFDIPLLKNRFRMNRVPGFPLDSPHLDLIHPGRRIFRRVFESCSLKSFEERLMGIVREGDIPGWLIPEVYFSYQHHGETERIPSVIAHNLQDIRSMYTLLVIFNGIYREVDTGRYENLAPASLKNIARYLYRHDLESFIDVIRFIGGDILTDRSLFKKFSTALKRTGRLDEAIAFWEKDRSLFSLEELAKHAEHREKNFTKALDLCDEAMDILDRKNIMDLHHSSGKELSDLHRERFAKRIDRLRRKAGGV
ncbi:MAG TPA: ribonuclease H-like domain-containing protein [Spirochaetota bacterium]|nr:ribonuclease H-like domain-containing protein [Spirochaetota bacterium]